MWGLAGLMPRGASQLHRTYLVCSFIACSLIQPRTSAGEASAHDTARRSQHEARARQIKPVIATSWVSIATSIRTESGASSSCSRGGGGGMEPVGLFQVVTLVWTL